jgi:hypothetical protein
MTTPVITEEPAEWRVAQEAHGPVLYGRSGDGAWVRVHSARDPHAEARHWLESSFEGRSIPPVVAVLGCGMGYVVDALEAKAPDTTVLVIEPSPVLAQLFLERRDWSPRIRAGRLFLFVGPDYAVSSEAAAQLAACDQKPPVLAHAVLARLSPKRLADAWQQIERRRFGLAANAEARRRFAGPYLLNTLRNLPALQDEANVAALDGAFDGRPIFVVGAGPSLDANLTTLTRIRDRGVLICVDTALPPLMRHGLVPDVVVAIDPSELNARHVTTRRPDARTWLVAEGSISPHALARFPGRIFGYRVAVHHPWPWLIEHGLDRGLLRAWGSVLITTIDLASRMGADPIILFGCDLAYTGGRSHARGVAHEEIWALHGFDRDEQSAKTLAAADTVVTRDALDGTPVRTLPHLLEFRDWLVAHLPPHRRIINATGAGLLHGPGIELADPVSLLRDALAFDPTPILRARHEEGRPDARHRQQVTLRSDLATRQQWMRDVPGVTEDMIAAAESPHSGAAVLSDDARPAVAFDPAVTAAIASLLRCQNPPAWARDRLRSLPLPGESTDGCLRLARHALRRLLAEPRVVMGVRPAVATLRAMFGRIPCSVLFETPVSSADTLTEFECCLAHLAARFEQSSRTFVWDRPWWPHTSGPDPVADAGRVPWKSDGAAEAPESGQPSDIEAFARWLLVFAQARAETLVVGDNEPDITGLLDVVVETIGTAAASTGQGTVRLELAAEPPELEAMPVLTADIEPWMLGRAITGALIPANASSSKRTATSTPARGMRLTWSPFVADSGGEPQTDPRVRFMGACRRVPGIRLGDRGLSNCVYLTRLDDRTVLALPRGSARAMRISADGTLQVDDVEWPWPIVRTSIQGDERVALGSGEHSNTLGWWREGRCDRQMSLPSSMWNMMPDGAGGLVCSGATGDVLRIRVDEGANEAADIRIIGREKWGIGVATDGAEVVIAEVARAADGRARRRCEGRSWHLHGDDEWIAVPNGSWGPSWGSARQNGWTATTHPHVDIVRLALHGEPIADLAVFYPTFVAWAGKSLAVLNGHGEALLFPDLQDLCPTRARS